jgi:hypothetical protein
MTVQPANVYPPPQGRPNTYNTYNTNYVNTGAPPGPGPGGPGPGGSAWARARGVYNRVPAMPGRAANPSVPRGLGFLNQRPVVFSMWMIAMITVGFDEWHNNNILPRPARLWDTSLLYGMLVLFGFVDPLVPLANAFAIGYTLVLLYQYYNGGLSGGSSGNDTQQATTGNTPGGGGVVLA